MYYPAAGRQEASKVVTAFCLNIDCLADQEKLMLAFQHG